MSCCGLSPETCFILSSLGDWFGEGHVTQQSCITNNLAVLEGHQKVIHSFLTCGSAGEVAYLCIRFQVRFRSTCLHPRLLRCWELAFLVPVPKGPLPKHPMGAFLGALLMSSTHIPWGKQITWPRTWSMG